MERLTAVKCAIGHLLAATFVEKSGADASYAKTTVGNVSRANIVAIVVGKPAANALVLDDGSGRIEARAFDNTKLFENIMVGDIILLIGRPRTYQSTLYVVAEIARRLGSPTWLELRKRELQAEARQGTMSEKKMSAERDTKTKEEHRHSIIPNPVPSLEKKSAPKKPMKDEKAEKVITTTSDKVLAAIKELDDGNGAAVEKIIAKLGGSAETILTNLMAEGEIFELRPGKVKVLE